MHIDMSSHMVRLWKKIFVFKMLLSSNVTGSHLEAAQDIHNAENRNKPKTEKWSLKCVPSSVHPCTAPCNDPLNGRFLFDPSQQSRHKKQFPANYRTQHRLSHWSQRLQCRAQRCSQLTSVPAASAREHLQTTCLWPINLPVRTFARGFHHSTTKKSQRLEITRTTNCVSCKMALSTWYCCHRYRRNVGSIVKILRLPGWHQFGHTLLFLL